MKLQNVIKINIVIITDLHCFVSIFIDTIEKSNLLCGELAVSCHLK